MKELTILELLTRGGNQHALDLVNKSDGKFSHRALQMLLTRMEENRLVQSWYDKPPALGKGYIGFARKLYKITELGQNFLKTFGANKQNALA